LDFLFSLKKVLHLLNCLYICICAILSAFSFANVVYVVLDCSQNFLILDIEDAWLINHAEIWFFLFTFWLYMSSFMLLCTTMCVMLSVVVLQFHVSLFPLVVNP
jgi:hypothetical protein